MSRPKKGSHTSQPNDSKSIDLKTNDLNVTDSNLFAIRAHLNEAPVTGDLPSYSVQVVSNLLETLAESDLETYLHCQRVGHLSAYLAKQMGLSPYQILISRYAGALHDIGKQEIPFEVLHKPGKLTAEEYKLVQDHPVASAKMIEQYMEHSFFRFVHTGVLYHHERVDGAGYPQGISNVPLVSRIILVADTYDAMKNTRSYRTGLSEEKIFQELKDYSGKQFDSEIAKTFIESFKCYRPENWSSIVDVTELQESFKKAAA